MDIITDNPVILLCMITILICSYLINNMAGGYWKTAVLVSLITSCFCMSYALMNPNDSSKDLIDISQCKLLEENNYNGIFSENTNKLDCNGVIKNVPISEYDKAINLPKKEG